MKPIKPKKLSKKREEWFRRAVDAGSGLILPAEDLRTILAALEYERRLAEEALDHIAEHAKDFGGTPRGQTFDTFLTNRGRPRAALTFGERHAEESK